MSDQEKSLRRYMAVLADELNKCKDPGKAKRYAVELTRMRSLLEQIKKGKEGSKEK